jgi:F-type H+-transporting ATPase subunit b
MRGNFSPRRGWQLCRLPLAAGVVLLIFCWLGAAFTAGVGRALAQETPGVKAQAAPPPAESPDDSDDITSQLKHSASVRLISRVTGLDLEASYWLAMVVNFAIVVAVIVWVAKKNVPAMFRNRTAMIQKGIEEARRTSQEANRRLEEIESRLSRLDSELGAMRASAETEAAAEEQRIQAAAEEDARRIVETAEQEITAALRSARRELKGYAADLAVSLAEKQIHVDAKKDQELVHNFARQLSPGGDRHGRQ